MESFSKSSLEQFQETNHSNTSDIYQLLEDIQDVCSPSNSDVTSSDLSAWTVQSLWQANNIGTSVTMPSVINEQAVVANKCMQSYPKPIRLHHNSSFYSYTESQIPHISITSVQSKVKHRAEISLIQTSKTQFKAIIKRKRKRTMFTTEQIQALEEVFKTKPYIIRKDREELADRLQISDKSVKVWFQNRRLKCKRRPSTEFNESLLDYIETQINEKTDEFGYVTLDDQVMSELVNVVDNLLSNGVETSSDEASDTTSVTESSPIYEPISPASVTDNEDYNYIVHQPHDYFYSNEEYLQNF